METLIPKLNADEKRRFEQSMEEIARCFPIKELLKCPLGTTGTIEIRVSRWPDSQSDFDAIISVLQSLRQAFSPEVRRLRKIERQTATPKRRKNRPTKK